MSVKTSDQNRRAFWLKHLHRWHWISSAVSLLGMLLFAATGFTLNHSAQIEAHPQVTTKAGTLPADVRAQLEKLPDEGKAPLPAVLAGAIAAQIGVTVGDREAQWAEDEVYLSLPRPGGDAWLSIERQSGAVKYELTNRGWISYLNDLHKGRNTGEAWKWFIDIFALACFIFCLTGLVLLQLHAGHRPTTWPLVGLGIVIPVLLAILFIH